MKYGLLYYKETANLGDDVQSYAAKRFLPQIDYMIDREQLDSFIPDKEELVATIMNGWYMDYKFNWPPTPYIYPLLISMHFSPYDLIGNIEYQHLTGYGLDYFKSFKEVGCRDEHTLNIFKKLGIPSYLSGCMTLTIEKIPNIEKEDYILLVDVNENIEQAIRKNTNKEIRKITNTLDSSEHNILNWDEREKKVINYLTMIQKASLVITPRLHSALPSLAVETPVLLVNYSKHNDRIGTFLQYLYYTTEEELLNNTCEYDINSPVKNKDEYLKIRSQLEVSCKNFIEETTTIENSNLPNIEQYEDFVNKNNFQKEIFLTCMDKFKNIHEENIKEKIRLESIIEKTTNDYNKLAKESKEIWDYKLKLEEELSQKKSSKFTSFFKK